MSDTPKFSRRERQIMDAVFTLGEATEKQVVKAIPDAPTPMAVRRMMHILEEKGRLKRREGAREVVYLPTESKAKAGITALRRVLDTFFGGAVDEALAAHLNTRETVTPAQLARIRQLIDKAKKEGR